MTQLLSGQCQMKNKLIQLLNDNSRSKKDFRIENMDGDEATVYIYDAIGDWYGIAAEDFVRDFNAITASTIHIRINSPGGDVFEARAIQTAIRQHKSHTIAHIDGLAASAATGIAEAANEVEISPGSFFMIHNSWTLAIGNSIELRDTAEMLDKVDASILADYEKKTGKSADEIKEWMNAETWFDATEAVEHGFCDRLADDANESTENRWNLSAYSNTPKALKEKPKAKQPSEPKFDRELNERRMEMLNIIG